MSRQEAPPNPLTPHSQQAPQKGWFCNFWPAVNQLHFLVRSDSCATMSCVICHRTSCPAHILRVDLTYQRTVLMSAFLCVCVSFCIYKYYLGKVCVFIGTFLFSIAYNKLSLMFCQIGAKVNMFQIAVCHQIS